VLAVEPRVATPTPSLTFNGTTASCSVVCTGDSKQDKIDVKLTLYQGSSRVTSWSASGTQRVRLAKEYTVKSGKSYTLTVTYSINGTEQTPVSVTATCP